MELDPDDVDVGRDAIAALLAMRKLDAPLLQEIMDPYLEDPPRLQKMIAAMAAVFFDVAERYRRHGDKTIEEALESHKWWLAQGGGE